MEQKEGRSAATVIGNAKNYEMARDMKMFSIQDARMKIEILSKFMKPVSHNVN